MAWLDAHQPQDVGACVIHNDWRFDNVVLDPGDLSQIRAVLDWELATVGIRSWTWVRLLRTGCSPTTTPGCRPSACSRVMPQDAQP